MPTYSCRYEQLVVLAAVIEGVEWPDDLPPCTRPAAYSTWVKLRRDGQDADTYTRQCEVHDAACHAFSGYFRSTRLYTPKPVPS
jgi:hypothetical protein